jgi:hypothetical protein
MIINLNNDKNEVVDLLANLPNEKVLDITGALQNKSIENVVIFARELDKNHSIEKKSIENYVNTIGQLSRAFRNIQINSISIWWLTGISEKHDSFHWGQPLFFLFHLIKEHPALFNENLHFILPKKNIGLSKFIEDNISIPHPFEISFSKNNEKDLGITYLIKSMVKAFLSLIIFKLNAFKISSSNTEEQCKYFFITPSTSVANNNDHKFNVAWITKLISKTKTTNNIPYLDFNRLNQLDLNQDHIKKYSKSAPSLKKIFLTFIRILFLFKNIGKKVKEHEANTILFNKRMVVAALKEVLRNLNYFLNHEWLRNHSQEHQNTFYLYADEMYRYGRLLSHALLHENNKTIGIQHGLITNNHTVYRITDEELTGTFQIPLPSKIILWNQSFGNVLTKSCKTISNRLLFANDYHYLELIQKINILKKEKKPSKKINILWATTLWDHFNNEYEVIKSLFELNTISLTIRLHPVGHISKNQIEHKLIDKDYSISEVNFEEDLAQADIIITNTFSTVFYDAMKVKTPVFRIEHHGSFSDIENAFESVFDVNNSKDFSRIFNEKVMNMGTIASKNVLNNYDVTSIKNYLGL